MPESVLGPLRLYTSKKSG